MQVNDFNSNLEDFHKRMRSDDDFKSHAELLRVKTTNLPEGMRTPTAQELSDMETYAKQYGKQFPKASKREIRRAVQKKFNVQLLPNT